MCAREAKRGNIVCGFFYFVYNSLLFMAGTRAFFFFFACAREGKREGEKESILNFLLKRKFICSC